MNEDYKKEIADLKYKMQKAEKFAEKLPFLSDVILERKISGDEQWIKFGERYKGIYLAWGINRGLFEQGTTREVINYRGEPYKEYLFNVYINTLSQYNSHENFGLNEIKDTVPVFFYDCLNSTFYATDDQIEALLDALVVWHKEAEKQLIEHNKKIEIEKLSARLNELSNS